MRIRIALGAAALGFWVVSAQAQPSMDDWYTIANAASHNDMGQVMAILGTVGPLDRIDADVVDSAGRTALDYAASFNNATMAQVLIDHGANVDFRDPLGYTPLFWAAERSNLEVMKLLIDSKATVDAFNRQGVTPLMAAAGHSQPQAVRLLIQRGADPKKQDYTGRDSFGWGAGKPAVIQALNTKR
jgi:ankyrin repeat protein